MVPAIHSAFRRGSCLIRQSGIITFASLIIIFCHAAQSPAQQTWTVQKSGTTNPLFCVAWGNSLFVAVGVSGTVLTSPDGITWTARSSGTTKALAGVAWGNNEFVTVGDSGVIATSPDGITWTQRASGGLYSLFSVCWGNNTFVAVGPNSTILTSPDGIAWTVRSSLGANTIRYVTWGKNQFFAVDYNSHILTSPDGATWNVETLGTYTYCCIGIFSNLSLIGGSDILFSSLNDTLWSYRLTTLNVFYGVSWGNSQYVTAGSFGAIYTSPDGTNWTDVASGTAHSLYSLLCADTRFIAVGDSGTIVTSIFPGSLSTTITASGTGAPVSGATVTMTSGGTQTQTTNAGGTATFSNLAPGNYVFSVSAPGYATTANLAVTITSGQTTTKQWSLTLLPPAAPALVAPSSGSAGISLTPAISWSTSAYAASYRVELSANSSFSTTVMNAAGLTATSMTGSGLSYGTTYFWRANAGNAGGTGAWSATWSFTTLPLPLPGVPVLVSPTNGGNTGPASTPAVLVWNASTNAASYRLQLSSSSTFSSTLFDASGLTATSRSVSGLAVRTTVYWRVNAANSSGTSGWSGAWKFVVGPSAVLPQQDDGYSKWFSFSRSGIIFDLPAASGVSITLYDLKGRLVRQVLNAMQDAGLHTVNLNGASMTPGSYILEFKSNCFVYQNKVTLVN